MLAATAELREVLAPVLKALGFPKAHTCPTMMAFLPWQPVTPRDWDHTVFAYINTNDSDLNLSVTAKDVVTARYELLRQINARLEEQTRKAAERREEAERDHALWDSANRALCESLRGEDLNDLRRRDGHCTGCGCKLARWIGGLEEHTVGCPNFPL
jgi:hypothetical protein